MSVFAEPLAQVEDALVYLEGITLSLGPGERTTKLASARAALDLIEQRATGLLKERNKTAEQGRIAAKRYSEEAERRMAAERRATDMEKALREIRDTPVPYPYSPQFLKDIARAALSAREEAS